MDSDKRSGEDTSIFGGYCLKILKKEHFVDTKCSFFCFETLENRKKYDIIKSIKCLLGEYHEAFKFIFDMR